MATLTNHPSRLSRHLSTAIPPHTLCLPLQLRTFAQLHTHIDEHLCGQVLDRYPDIKTLKTLHCKMIYDQSLRSNPSIGVKLMRAYAACGQPRVSHQVFDEIPEKNIILFNVMIRSYVNNQGYQEALNGFKDMSRYYIRADHYSTRAF